MASAEADATPPAAGKGKPARNARRDRSVLLLSVLVITALVSAGGAWLGFWWVPFLLGAVVGAGSRSRRTRGGLLSAVLGAIIGWLIPIWVLALRGQPVGATARAIAGLAGLPPYAGVTLAVLALLAALQVWVGAWLAHAVFAWTAGRPGKTDTPPGAAGSAVPVDPAGPQT
jgi:hypothetical protein